MRPTTEPTEAPGRVVKDPELVALQDISKAMAALDPAARARVLEWVNKKDGAAE
jgi:hypothetical protein